MDKQAFEIIQNRLYEELQKQSFAEGVSYDDEKGKAVMFATEEVAYSICFWKAKSSFVLQSTTLTAEGKPGTWRQLSLWLFDEAEGTNEDAVSIANDFIDVVQGPKRIAAIQTAKKKGKKKGDDENNIDPLFFFNRLVGIFPELKDLMNDERIIFGQIRYATMAKDAIAPKCQELAMKKPQSDEFKKLRTLFNDMYKDGDSDLRSIITAGILNNISDQGAIDLITEDFSDDFKKVYKCSRKLIGKNIKPEKVKKSKKVIAAALNNANK